MSITDELQESVMKKCWHMLDADGYYELLAIADRIDEQHRKALEKISAMVDEEIVRCKDCGYMEQRVSFDGSICWFLCTHLNRPTRRDGFCAWGDNAVQRLSDDKFRRTE